MTEELKILATFGTPIEADMVKNRLEASDIRAFLADEYTVGWLWHLGVGLHGVKVLVAESDLERAVAILAEAERLRRGRQTPDGDLPAAATSAAGRPSGEDTTIPSEAQSQQQWPCPKCGEQVGDEFDVCWSCGAGRDGTEHSEFFAEPTSEDRPMVFPAEPLADHQLEQPRPEPNVTAQRQLPVTWTCPRCGTEVEAELEVCWACGTTVDGIEDDSFRSADVSASPTCPDDQESGQPPGPGFALLIALGFPIGMIIMFAGIDFFKTLAADSSSGAYMLFVLACYSLVIALFFGQFLQDSPDSRQPEKTAESPGVPSAATVAKEEEWGPVTIDFDAIVRRAWIAALFGVFFCPLLNFYSIWLILRHELYRTADRRKSSFFVYSAIVFNALVCLFVLMAFLASGELIGR